MKSIIKNNKAITLLALVITIIILLILAGVAIGTLGGENGLIAKVNQAKRAQIKAEMKEELILAINDLQLEKEGKATLDDVTQEWINRVITDYDCTIISDASISGKKVTMQKSGVIGKYIIDQNLNITENADNNSNVEFSYEVGTREGDIVKILIRVQDKENGLNRIVLPDDEIEVKANKKEEKGINYEAELGVEYKFKIISENGQTTEETILIEDYWHTITKNLGEGVEIDNPAIKAAYNKPYEATLTVEGAYVINAITVKMDGTDVTSTVYDTITGKISIEKVTGDIEITATTIKLELEITTPTVNTSNSTSITTSTDANSVEKGTTLYINFKATLKDLSGGTFTIKYNESEVTMPFAVTTNGKYTFTITGIYQGKTAEPKIVEVTVNQYQGATGVVQYDAGTWTQEEIEELQAQKLYDINIERNQSNKFKVDDESGLNCTFGGFTYKGDTENESEANSGTVVTSRNQSVAPASLYGIPRYEGWQILESKEENGKTYVTKLVHAGSPENFCFSQCYTMSEYGYIAEYLLSGGTRQILYNETIYGGKINPRSWDMYKDKTLDEKGYINEVHAMTYDEAFAITKDNEETNGLRNTGAVYHLASAREKAQLRYVDIKGKIVTGTDGFSEWPKGIRPVVTLNGGVYIVSGSGIKEDPYILGKE